MVNADGRQLIYSLASGELERQRPLRHQAAAGLKASFWRKKKARVRGPCKGGDAIYTE